MTSGFTWHSFHQAFRIFGTKRPFVSQRLQLPPPSICATIIRSTQYDTTQSAATEIKPSHLEIGKVVFNSKRSGWKGSGSVKNVIVWLKWLWGFVIFFILQSKGWTSSKGDSGLTANSWPSECNKQSQPMRQYSIVPLTCDDAECMNSPRT